jgi:hypothetical protein
MTSRYETPFQIAVSRDHTRHLANNGPPSNRQQLTVNVSGESLQARWPANDTFDNPPQFTARLESRRDGVLVTGTIRESWSSMAASRIMLMTMFLMIAVAVLGVAVLTADGARAGLPPLLIGVIGAPAFALMWRWLGGQRKPTFDSDTRKLTTGLTQYLTTGDGSRSGI